MKSIYKILPITLMICLTGCSSIRFEEEWKEIDDFREKYHDKMVEYIENDQHLSGRDKNTFITKLEIYEECLEKIRKYFSKK